MTVEWIHHSHYTQARITGVLTDADIVPLEEVPATVERRLLVDMVGVTGFEVSLPRRISVAERRVALNDRVAVVAPLPFVFGLCRQTALMARVRLNENYAVFDSMSPAVAWLLGLREGE